MSLNKLLITPLAVGCLTLPAIADNKAELPVAQPAASVALEEAPLVQIAILLDTSGSMSGLIDQARCQLWNVVSELSTASQGSSPTRLEIAVYQYGTNSVPEDRGFLREITGFTENLDEVSRALFSLATGGSKEFCSQVIDTALTSLDWNPDSNVYKAVFVAGNESFDQGRVSFGQVFPKARSKEILLNSIYCASKDTASGTEQWESAAKLTAGMYFQIDHNHHLPQMKTPFDTRMRELNQQMNESFIWFGEEAGKVMANQQEQDRNAAKMSDHAFAARMSAKIGHLYHHVHHDLIDALQHGNINLDKMPVEKMPDALKPLSPEQRLEFVARKTAERDRIRREMAGVISKRHSFLQQKMSEQAGANGQAVKVLGDALVEAVRKQATQRGFTFDRGQTASVTTAP